MKLLTFTTIAVIQQEILLTFIFIFFSFSIQRLMYLENTNSANVKLNLSPPNLKILYLKSCSLYKILSYKGSSCFLQNQLSVLPHFICLTV